MTEVKTDEQKVEENEKQQPGEVKKPQVLRGLLSRRAKTEDDRK